MMPRHDHGEHSDPAAANVSLATEAALLEARLHILQEAFDTVDARIKEAFDALRLLRRDPAASAGAADSDDHCGSPGREDTGGLTDDACGERPERYMSCRP